MTLHRILIIPNNSWSYSSIIKPLKIHMVEGNLMLPPAVHQDQLSLSPGFISLYISLSIFIWFSRVKGELIRAGFVFLFFCFA